jgi:hypothetical protein
MLQQMGQLSSPGSAAALSINEGLCDACVMTWWRVLREACEERCRVYGPNWREHPDWKHWRREEDDD